MLSYLWLLSASMSQELALVLQLPAALQLLYATKCCMCLLLPLITPPLALLSSLCLCEQSTDPLAWLLQGPPPGFGGPSYPAPTGFMSPFQSFGSDSSAASSAVPAQDSSGYAQQQPSTSGLQGGWSTSAVAGLVEASVVQQQQQPQAAANFRALGETSQSAGPEQYHQPLAGGLNGCVSFDCLLAIWQQQNGLNPTGVNPANLATPAALLPGAQPRFQSRFKFAQARAANTGAGASSAMRGPAFLPQANGLHPQQHLRVNGQHQPLPDLSALLSAAQLNGLHVQSGKILLQQLQKAQAPTGGEHQIAAGQMPGAGLYDQSAAFAYGTHLCKAALMFGTAPCTCQG